MKTDMVAGCTKRVDKTVGDVAGSSKCEEGNVNKILFLPTA